MTQKWMCTSRISMTRTERVSHTSEERGSVGAFSFYLTLLYFSVLSASSIALSDLQTLLLCLSYRCWN